MSSHGYGDLFDRGVERLDNGDYDEAERIFDELIRLSPQSSGSWGNRGYARLQTGRDEEALADFDMVASLDPDDPFGHGFRALALYYLNRFDDALPAAAEAVELSDDEEDCPPARLARAFMFLREGQFEAAWEDLDAYIRFSPEDEAIGFLLELSEFVRETGERTCPDGPDGRLRCDICMHSQCGFSFNRLPNPHWEQEGGRCPYEHCIETMPARAGLGPGVCPVFGHDCPGGEQCIADCPMVDDLERDEFDSGAGWPFDDDDDDWNDAPDDGDDVFDSD